MLERAFAFVMEKFRSGKEWSYISDQLKSIRQDLMVQAVRNDFTVLVYEENARLALEAVSFVFSRKSFDSVVSFPILQGDREQFNQCQTQLETLYDSGCNREHFNEFLLYRFLYSLLLNDSKSKSTGFDFSPRRTNKSSTSSSFRSETSRILIDIDRVIHQATANGKSNRDDIENLRRARDFSSAIRRKNYSRFFSIYRSLPSLASSLVNLFIDIYRKHMLKALVWG